MKIKIIIMLALALPLVLLSASCTGAPSVSTEISSSVPAPDTRNLINGVITIGAGEYYDIKFEVDTGTMRGTGVTGAFKASGGSGNDIEVSILNDAVFGKWITGHNEPTLYYSGKSTSSNISVAISNSGNYHLIFDNSFSLISSKEVNAKVDLFWSK
jgi:hypothetical protein